MLPVEQPFKTYTGKDGKPLNDGYVYFGEPGKDPKIFRVQVYWDADGTTPASQPLRTENGYIVRGGTPANVFFDGSYSELVLDSKRRQVFYARSSDEFSIATYVRSFVSSLSDSVGSGLLGFIQAGTGAVKRTLLDKMRETSSVKDFGAVGDGVKDDTAAIQKALDAGPAFLPRGKYVITSTLYVDYSKTSLYSNGAEIVSQVPAGMPAIMVFSTANYGPDGKDPYTKNYVCAACSGFSLTGPRQMPEPTGGTGYIGFQIGRAGGTYFQSGDAEIFKCAVYGFDTQVFFADNGWRPKFKECSLTGGSYPIWFSNPNNAGEVMTFEGCWIVGWSKTLLINGGYFVFDRCSLFGSATGLFVTQFSAMVMLRDCNVEVSNARSIILFSVETTSRFVMNGGSIVFDSTMTAPIFQGDTSTSMVSLRDVSLPLYGDNFKYEQNAYGDNQIRGMVQRGTNMAFQSTGCFPKAGVITTNTTVQAIPGGNNIVANGGVSAPDFNPWLPFGTPGTYEVYTPGRNGPRAFKITSGAIYQDLTITGNPGRWFGCGVWSKSLAGSGNVGSVQVLFMDTATGATLGTHNVAIVTSAQTNWTWNAYNNVIPDGANIARIILDANASSGASAAFDDVTFQMY